jgi:hypothetical protein
MYELKIELKKTTTYSKTKNKMNSKQTLLAALALVATIFFTSCEMIRGEGEVNSYSVELENIENLELDISADLYLTQGETQEVVIEAQENIFYNIHKTAKNGKWEIKFLDPVMNHKKVKIYITLPTVKAIDVNGSGEVFAENEFTGLEELLLEIDGSGEIDMQAQTQKLITEVDGSGKIYVKGSANEITAEIDGSGKIRAFNTPVKDARVDISGSGEVEVDVENTLSVRIIGSGEVYYKGRPAITSMDIDGSGKAQNVD